VNVGFFPSIWPETFSFVVQEMMDMGVPLCCFDLGAPAERVGSYRLGRIIPEVSPEAALGSISELYRSLRRSP